MSEELNGKHFNGHSQDDKKTKKETGEKKLVKEIVESDSDCAFNVLSHKEQAEVLKEADSIQEMARKLYPNMISKYYSPIMFKNVDDPYEDLCEIAEKVHRDASVISIHLAYLEKNMKGIIIHDVANSILEDED